jgi:hypothetical protein
MYLTGDQIRNRQSESRSTLSSTWAGRLRLAREREREHHVRAYGGRTVGAAVVETVAVEERTTAIR